jgi:hypothetical protein
MAPARAAGGMAVRRGLLTGEYGVQVHELPYAEQRSPACNTGLNADAISALSSLPGDDLGLRAYRPDVTFPIAISCYG